jgi:hypothetical protein
MNKTEGQRPSGRLKNKRKGNIKVNHKETGIEYTNWIHLAKDIIGQWWT